MTLTILNSLLIISYGRSLFPLYPGAVLQTMMRQLTAKVSGSIYSTSGYYEAQFYPHPFPILTFETVCVPHSRRKCCNLEHSTHRFGEGKEPPKSPPSQSELSSSASHNNIYASNKVLINRSTGISQCLAILSNCTFASQDGKY
ncbi:hypothetical protein FM036_43160 [Nostoc sp. HG1]|nr:hypothetical protein [Nostoc sp. HG1]